MIKLVNRELVLRNETFASFIYDWQRSYDPTNDAFMKMAGIYHDWDIGKDRFFSQVECDQIRQSQIEEYYNSIDSIKPIPQKQISEKIFNLRYHDTFIYTIELGNILEKLSAELQCNIFFFPELKIPWLYQKNEYKPVRNALNYLKSIGVSEDYCGGIESNGEDLKELTTNLFWIIRCNAAISNIWFCDGSNKYIGDLCMHGNLHFHFFDKKIERRIFDFAKQEDLKSINECEEEFEDNNEFGGIMGRETIFP